MKSQQNGRMNASTARTVKLLSSALTELLKREQLEKITVVDICRLAAVPRATFYNHFEDKYDLLRNVLQDISSGIVIPRTALENEYDYIRRLAENLLDFCEDNSAWLKKISKANYNGVFFSELKNFFFDEILKDLNENEKRGKVYKVDTRIISEFYSNAIVYSAKTWMESGMNISKEKILDSVMLLIAIDK